MSKEEQRIVPDEDGKCPVGYHKMNADDDHDSVWCMEGESHDDDDESGYGRSESIQKETRICNDLHLAHTRSEDDSVADTPKIVGYASVFNSMSENLGGFRELIQRGAFAKSLTDNDEVHALFNHDDNKILGRRGAGTLKLWEDDHGLRVEIDPPNTTDGNDVVELLRRGDLVSMSFGFYNIKDDWETRDGEDIRTIKEAKLFDVSVVTNPAYQATEVNVRSYDKYVASKTIEKTDFNAIGETIDLRLKLRLAEEI